jgi:hypothetical protein
LATSSTSQAQLTPSQVNNAESAQWRTLLRQASFDLRVHTPAFLLEDMDPDTQTVTVQIAIQERVRTLMGPQWYDIAPLFNVPIMIQRGGGCSITLPLKKGDEGMLMFCDCCFDLWWQNGQQGAPVADNAQELSTAYGTPVPSGSQQQIGMHRHEVNDCGFYPGFYSQPNVLSNYSTTSLQVRMDDGSAIVDVSSGAVKVMNHGGMPLALVNDTWYQWWKTNIFPFLQGLGYVGPPIPMSPETTILKGQ